MWVKERTAKLIGRQSSTVAPMPIAPAVSPIIMVSAKKEDIEVHMENDTLKIKATRKTATAEMHYERAFKLAKDLDTEKAEVSFENGVLVVKLGKKASATARKLVIK